jgi:hypothetical protein
LGRRLQRQILRFFFVVPLWFINKDLEE